MDSDEKSNKKSITFTDSDESESVTYPLLSKYIPLYLEKSIDSPEIEMELIYGESENSGRLSKSQFLRLLRVLRGTYKGAGESTTLDIRKQIVRLTKVGASDIRVTIEGVSDIRKYCQTNDISGVPCTFMKKQEYKDPKNPSIKYIRLKNQEYMVVNIIFMHTIVTFTVLKIVFVFFF